VEGDSNIFWAKEWFARARSAIEQTGDECSFEHVLALYFLVAIGFICLSTD